MTVRQKRFLGCSPTPVRPDFSSFLVQAHSEQAAVFGKNMYCLICSFLQCCRLLCIQPWALSLLENCKT